MNFADGFSTTHLKSEYDRRLPLLEHLRSEVVFTVDKALAATGIKLHSVTSRIKDFESFSRKVRQKAVAVPFEDIHDLVGARIVCLFLSDIDRIVATLRSAFDVVREDDRIQSADVSSFGYMSLHFDAAIKAAHTGPRYDPLKDMLFELQIRTIAMDAWANVSHHLRYHKDVDVPEELRRDFHALSGLFYVADKHFEMFYQSRTSARAEAARAVAHSPTDTLHVQPLNGDSLTAYLTLKYRDRETGTSKLVSDLLSELLYDGFTSLGEIDELIEATAEAFARYERDSMPRGDKFYAVGVVRASLYICSKDYLRRSIELEHGGETNEKLIDSLEARFGSYRSLVRRRPTGAPDPRS